MFLFLGECCIWAFWLWVFLGGGCSGNCSSRDHQAGHSRRLRSYLGGASGSESVCLGPWVPGIYPEMVLILLIPMLYNCVHLPCLQGIEGRVALWSGWHNPGTSTPALGIFPQAFPPPGGGLLWTPFFFGLCALLACLGEATAQSWEQVSRPVDLVPVLPHLLLRMAESAAHILL